MGKKSRKQRAVEKQVVAADVGVPRSVFRQRGQEAYKENHAVQRALGHKFGGGKMATKIKKR